MKHAALILLLSLASPLVQGETRYVSDQLKITLRSGPSTTHKILRMLPVGAPLEILTADAESGYSQVKFGDAVGFVLTRQLSPEPSAKDRLAATEKSLLQVQDENRRLTEQRNKLSKEHTSSQEELDRLDAENQRLSRDLESIRRTAAESLSIQRENEALKVSVQELENDLQVLRQENAKLKDGTSRDWFLVGAGVIILGILMGLILPRLRWHRRTSSWDTL